MNEHLTIPENIEQILNNIKITSLSLAELPLEPHPTLSQFDRSIRVLGIDAKSEQLFIYFRYEQVLKDRTTGQEIQITLPSPEWVVYKETWNYLRDDQNNPIELPLKEPIEDQTTDKVKVPSYQYMLWLLKNDKVSFLKLLSHYLKQFVEDHKDKLDKI